MSRVWFERRCFFSILTLGVQLNFIPELTELLDATILVYQNFTKWLQNIDEQLIGYIHVSKVLYWAKMIKGMVNVI